MSYLINFIKDYWYFIVPCIEIILTVLLIILRKKPVKVVDTLKEIIVRVLPSLIIGAERTGLKGSDKMKWLIDELTKILRELNYGDDVIAQYLPFVMDQVELILCTPQKKGVKK